MNHLDNLQSIANRQLGGLRATGKMLGEIKLKAAEKPKAHRFLLRPVLATCMTALLVIGCLSWIPSGIAPEGPAPSPSVLDSQPAGNVEQPDVNLLSSPNLSQGDVSVGKAVDAPPYRSIFAPAQGNTFPMLWVDNQAYRMLQSPSSVHVGLLSETLGEVMEYTLEPALSSGGIVSNIVSQGEAVYAIQNMRGALASANVEGNLRLFQRVSFAGSAILGSESLADTLCRAQDVASLELSGIGTISDSSTAQRLMDVLLQNAEYQGSGGSSGGSQALLVNLQNGLTLQLTVSGDSLSACGTWICPEFFEAFAAEIS